LTPIHKKIFANLKTSLTGTGKIYRTFSAKLSVVSAFAFTGFTCALHAQPAPSATNIEQSQRRQLEREQTERQRLERTPDVHLSAGEASDKSRLPDNESPCFKIKKIEFRGKDAARFAWLSDNLAGPDKQDSPLFEPSLPFLPSSPSSPAKAEETTTPTALFELAQPSVPAATGRCLGVQGIGIVLKRAQDALLAHGFVTSRVLAEPQDLTSGELALTVLPGRIRSIRFVPPVASGQPTPSLPAVPSPSVSPPSARGTAWNAVPTQVGDVLNIRDIEQALENFKRVPSAEADIQIAPAETPDESDLLISYQQDFPFRLSVSLDDSGTQSSGKYQTSLSLSYDNWWTLNDLFYVTLSHDLHAANGGANVGAKGTNGSTVHYSLPWGYWLLGVTANQSHYYQSVAGASQNYIYSGNSSNKDIKVSRLIYRDASRKTTLSLKAWQRQSNNFIDDTEIEVQRRIVGGWELGLSNREFIGKATLEGNLAYKRGTGAFGSIPAPEEAFGEGSSRLALITADANLSLPFKISDQTLRYDANWRMQLNRTPLTPQDRFAIGGRFSVRGFDGENSLLAERGWLIRNELGIALRDSGHEAYIGLDYGEVAGPSSEFLLGTRLSGAVIGVRGSFKKLQYDFFVGAPIKKPALFPTASSTFGMSLNINF
jgi:hemolysin activation/secretion protein